VSSILVKRRRTTGADAIADFDPTSIPNCIAWHKADRGLTLGSGQAVAAWADQTGNGRTWSQSTASVQPVLVANVMNGRPAIRSDSTTGASLQYLIGPSYASALASGGEIFIAMKVDNGTQHGLHRMGSGANNALIYANELYDQWGSTTSRYHPSPAYTIAGASTHIYNVISVAGEWTANIDGNQAMTSAANTVGWDAGGSLLMATSISGYASPAAATYFSGHMAEVIIYSRKLTTTERTRVTSELQRQYTFGPASVNGCALWLEAGKGVTLGSGSSVAFWADQSGHSRNFQQSDTTKQPTRVTSGINGQPSLAFSAAGLQYLIGPTLAALTVGCDVWIVFKRNSSAGTQGLWRFGGSAVESVVSSTGIITDNTGLSATSYTASAAANTTAAHVWNAYARPIGGTYAARLDGAVMASGVGASYGFDGAGSLVGATSAGGTTPSKYFDGQISAVVAYDSYLVDATDRVTVQNELKAKYGIA